MRIAGIVCLVTIRVTGAILIRLPTGARIIISGVKPLSVCSVVVWSPLRIERPSTRANELSMMLLMLIIIVDWIVLFSGVFRKKRQAKNMIDVQYGNIAVRLLVYI